MPLRRVWAHEAHHFTPWLLSQADRLAEVLGIDLVLTSAEHPVGGFSLDLIGRDLSNDAGVVAENVEDHDTYIDWFFEQGARLRRAVAAYLDATASR